MIFKASELLEKLNEIVNDGYDIVDISLMEADDELPAAMLFEVIEDEYSSIDYEEVEAIDD